MKKILITAVIICSTVIAFPGIKHQNAQNLKNLTIQSSLLDNRKDVGSAD
ncbi:hypothetical protein [Mucilaginibacter sp.]